MICTILIILPLLIILWMFLLFGREKVVDIKLFINNKLIDDMANLTISQSVILTAIPVDAQGNKVDQGLESIAAVSSNTEIFTVASTGNPGEFTVVAVAQGAALVTVTYQQTPESEVIERIADIIVTGEVATDLLLEFGEPFPTV